MSWLPFHLAMRYSVGLLKDLHKNRKKKATKTRHIEICVNMSINEQNSNNNKYKHAKIYRKNKKHYTNNKKLLINCCILLYLLIGWHMQQWQIVSHNSGSSSSNLFSVSLANDFVNRSSRTDFCCNGICVMTMSVELKINRTVFLYLSSKDLQ